MDEQTKIVDKFEWGDHHGAGIQAWRDRPPIWHLHDYPRSRVCQHVIIALVGMSFLILLTFGRVALGPIVILALLGVIVRRMFYYGGQQAVLSRDEVTLALLHQAASLLPDACGLIVHHNRAVLDNDLWVAI